MTGDTLAVLTATLAGAIVSVILSLLAWSRRETPGATAFCLMMAAVALWSAAYAGELLHPTLAGKELFGRLAYLGIVVVPPSWLLFAIAYTRRPKPPSRRLVVALFAVPALTVALVFIGVGPVRVWTGAALNTQNGMALLEVVHGPWFWVHLAYCFALLLLGSFLIVTPVLREGRVLAAQVVIVVLAVTAPWLMNALTIFDVITLPGLDLTPPAFAVSGVLLATGLARLRLLQLVPGILPMARDTVLHDLRDGVLILDKHGRIVGANRAAERLLAGQGSALVGAVAAELLSGAVNDGLGGTRLGVPGRFAGETQVVDPSGTVRTVDVAASWLNTRSHGSTEVLVLRDVTDRKHWEETLRYQALHDVLTGLPNRVLLRERAEALLALSRRRGEPLALLVVDLDRFKEVNDTFGHECGDELLRVVAERLRSNLRDSDVVARLGGDEFAIVLPQTNAATALKVARVLRDAVLTVVPLRGYVVSVSASVGVAISPDDGDDVGTLLQRADVALYLAKDTCGGAALYDVGRDPNSPSRLAMVSELRSAIEQGDLRLHYQPLLNLPGGASSRVEALVRWPHHCRGLLAAATFMPMVQQSGLMADLAHWVMENTVRQHLEWARTGLDVDIALNLSAMDLHDETLVERVAGTLRRTGVRPSSVVLEATETSMLRDPRGSARVLEELRDLGTRVVIDDFGVGHSSLAYVKTIPACELKIDRSFIGDMQRNESDIAIVRAATVLGHDLGLEVTAGGVETREQLEMVTALGCDRAQGYYLARPMPPEDVHLWLRAHRECAPLRAVR